MKTMNDPKNKFRLDYHIILITKDKAMILDDHLTHSLRHYIEEKAKQMDVLVHIANGAEDHIHILASVSYRHSVADIVRQLKEFTTLKMKRVKWAKNFAAYTVDRFSFDQVFDYIRNQKQFHLGFSLEDELMEKAA